MASETRLAGTICSSASALRRPPRRGGGRPRRTSAAAADNPSVRNRRRRAPCIGRARRAARRRRTPSCSRSRRRPGPARLPAPARHRNPRRGLGMQHRFQRSASRPSRRSSVKLVTLQISLRDAEFIGEHFGAPASTSRRIAPEPSRRTPAALLLASTVRSLYMPRGCPPPRPRASPDAGNFR